MPTPPAQCANPLLLQWVGEWLNQARERNTKGINAYKRAYDSLKACPFPFTHPSEAQQLQNIGAKLVERLTEKMEEYCKAANLPIPVPARGKKRTVVPADGEQEEASPPKKKRTSKPYVPALRSGGYAIILALSSTSTGLTKPETIALAEPHCDSSFTAVSGPGKFYTAWSSIKTLENKDLVYEQGRPTRKYFLTEEGWEVARRIKKAAGNGSTLEDDLRTEGGTVRSGSGAGDLFMDARPIASQASPEPSDNIGNEDSSDIVPHGTSSSEIPSFEPLALPPGTFTVQLVLDNREVRAKDDRDYIQIEMGKKGINPVVRPLALGDIIWVAKCHDPALLPSLGVEGDEIVLDFVVERKRLDDLLSSIKDGRFHEQKFRLRKSGIKNVIYLIEEISMSAEHFQRYEEAVRSAIASTQVVNGYSVKKTQKMDDTIRYLARMTAMLKEMYENKPLYLIPTRVVTARNYLPLVDSLRTKEPETNYHITYGAFASLASKSESLTLRDVFLKMLMCTKGVNGEKALEIQKRWKTPREFMEAYERCGDGEDGRKKKAEMVSSAMASFVGRKKITKPVSLKLAEVWGNI
jgi:crossover junction endonuclease MUS81